MPPPAPKQNERRWASVLWSLCVLAAPPIAERPLAQAQATLSDLRAGKIVGRVVLTA